MAKTLRRAILFLPVLLFFAFVLSDSTGLSSVGPVFAISEQKFDAPAPLKIHELDTSHGVAVPADANPAEGTTGYCVRVSGAGILGQGGPVDGVLESGFTVVDTAIPDTTPTASTIASVDVFTGTDPGSADDIYCATVMAGENLSKTTLQWTYTDGIETATLKLDITVFKVTLVVVDGVLGGSAEVCTLGWDPDILTGSRSNIPGTLPDTLDTVALGADPPDTVDNQLDWVIDTTGTVWDTVAGSVEKLGQFRKGDEWCMTFTADELTDNPDADPLTAGIDISLRFDAVYNLFTNADDQGHAPAADVDVILGPSELRHITPGGQVLQDQDANENVIGSRHYACIIPSEKGDTINPSDIHFSGNGPSVTDLQIFNDGDPGVPNFAGVVNGTICIGWVSSAPGEQFLTVTFTKRFFGGAPFGPEVRQVSWDSDADGNGNPDDIRTNRALITQWNVIDKTEITRGNDPDENIITDTTITVPVAFNVSDGTYFFSQIGLSEWVYGSHTGATGKISGLLDGVVVKARITTQCGIFEISPTNDDQYAAKTFEGVTVQGRIDVDPPNAGLDGLPDQFSVGITNDPNCNSNSTVRVEIDTYYPGPIGSGSNVFFGTEYVDIVFSNFTPGFKTPRLLWAGDKTLVTFALGGSCSSFDGDTIHFVRPENQPGTFLPSGGVTLDGPDHAYATFSDDNCSASVWYHSEVPGEVDVETFFSTKQFTKVAHPIFFLGIEDVTTTTTPELVVSARGDLSASVRGWFPGTNLSGREARVTEDGRTLPQDRWVLPDDWNLMRGPSDFRPSWPSSAPMPLTDVTFFMEDEGVVNGFKSGVKNGAAGWFLLDGTESSLNVSPFNNKASILGSVNRPRIITDLTDSDGIATVDTYGDFNLSYEDCDVNIPTGNPFCGIDDLVGTSRYYAIADYPADKGKFPPVKSNTAESRWTWAGYKAVTVQDTGTPGQKILVAHLRDRDGFCDAIGLNNTLGVTVNFQMDSGDGKIIEVQGQPSELDVLRRGADATSFDTIDDHGNPMHEDIAKTTLFDDECQAWIRISNSFLSKTNVIVTFPAPPAPVPGTLRITALQCKAPESVTVTNMGSNAVSLEGWALRSRNNSLTDPEEHLGLTGILQPGESKSFLGGTNNGWLFGGQNTTFDDPVGGSPDYARLVWNEFEISRRDCSGVATNPPIPASLPLDGEGEIQLDVIVDFAETGDIPLVAGWNLLTVTDGSIPVGDVLKGNEDEIVAIYAWNSATGGWDRYITDGPSYVSNLATLEAGAVYWVDVKRPFTLVLPK